METKPIKLIDTRATEVVPSSVFLTRAEFKGLYPHRLNSRISYVFKGGIPKTVELGEAKLLLKKYSHVVKWMRDVEDYPESNRYQELEKMKYNDLKKHGAEIGLEFKNMMVKTPMLIETIIEKELSNTAKAAKAKALKEK